MNSTDKAIKLLRHVSVQAKTSYLSGSEGISNDKRRTCFLSSIRQNRGKKLEPFNEIVIEHFSSVRGGKKKTHSTSFLDFPHSRVAT